MLHQYNLMPSEMRKKAISSNIRQFHSLSFGYEKSYDEIYITIPYDFQNNVSDLVLTFQDTPRSSPAVKLWRSTKRKKYLQKCTLKPESSITLIFGSFP